MIRPLKQKLTNPIEDNDDNLASLFCVSRHELLVLRPRRRIARQAQLTEPQRSVEVLRDFVTPLVAINPGRLAVSLDFAVSQPSENLELVRR
jgi:hypothetical protein